MPFRAAVDELPSSAFQDPAEQPAEQEDQAAEDEQRSGQVLARDNGK
jgi:hypothetical protein